MSLQMMVNVCFIVVILAQVMWNITQQKINKSQRDATKLNVKQIIKLNERTTRWNRMDEDEELEREEE